MMSRTSSPVEEMRKVRAEQKKTALKKLKGYTESKATLGHPVFFIPGWTDENCSNWVDPFKNADAMQGWIKKTVNNPDWVYFVTFSEAETKACISFEDFGLILKNKIKEKIGNKKFDIVGHSMGGLDIRAAVAIHGLKNIHRCITVATPHQGSQWGDIGPKIKKYSAHHAIQCINLDPDQRPIKNINLKENKEKFLNTIDALFQIVGTRDMAVMKWSKLDTKEIETSLKEKISTIEIGGATHSAKDGITRDVRSVAAILDILTGVKIEESKYNYGYLYKQSA